MLDPFPVVEPTPDEPGPSLRQRLVEAARGLRRTGRLMCGIPDYDGYVAHLRQHHPDKAVPSYRDFFRDRLEARYGGKGGTTRCC